MNSNPGLRSLILGSLIREKMRDSGKVNKHNQLPRLLVSSTREFQLLTVLSAASFLCENLSLASFPQKMELSRIFP
jgi:hypothetical protein